MREQRVETGPLAPRRTVRPYALKLPGVAGFVGAVCVLIGVAQPGSPFVLKAPGAWFFGASARAPSAAGSSTFLGIMLVYAGLVVMIGSLDPVFGEVDR